MKSITHSKYQSIVLLILLSLTAITAYAQSNVVNNGATIRFDSNVNVSVAGSVINAAGGLLDNAGTLTVGGDFTNNSGGPGLTADTGTVELNSDSDQVIGGSSTSGFNILDLSGDGNKLLAIDTDVTDTLNLAGADLILQSNTLSVLSSDPAAISTAGGVIVSETTDAASIVSWAIDTATGIFNLPFATQTGTPITVTAAINTPAVGAGSINFATYPTGVDNLPLPPVAVNLDILDAVTDDADVAVNRFWVADSQGFATPPGYTLSVTTDPANDLSFSGGELDGNLSSVQFVGGDWADGNTGVIPAGAVADVAITTAGVTPVAITGVNDEPSFAINDDGGVFVGNQTDPQTIAGFANAIDLGALDDIEQAANFIVEVNDPSLFTVLPTISADGTLDFVASPSAAGSDPAEVTVTLNDGGGVEFGGVDTSLSQTFLILFDVIEVPTLSTVGLGILFLMLLVLARFTPAMKMRTQNQ